MAATDDVLQALHSTSLTLWARINDPAVDDATRNALNLEYIEVSHRISILLGKKLSAELQTLTEKASAIQTAGQELRKTLETVNTAEGAVKSVTAFLRGVDSFIDIAKKYFV